MSSKPADSQSNASPKSLNCPSCGAALPAGEGRVECSYCGTIVQIDRAKPKQHMPKPGEPAGGVVWSAPSVTIVQTRRVQRGAKKSGGGCVMLTVAVPILFAGLVLLLVFGNVPGAITRTNIPSVDKVFQERLYPLENVTVLTPDQSLPQLVVLVNGSGDNARRLALIDSAKGERLWLSDPVSDDASTLSPVAYSDDAILFADGRTLRSFARADGKQRWQAQLSDSACETCLVVAGGAAIALTTDYILQGIDLATGELLWSNDDLGDYAERRLTALGDNVLVYARNADYDGEARIIDATTGDAVRQFTPACRPDPFSEENTFFSDVDSAKWLSPDQRTLIVQIDASEPCFVAYDMASGERRWQGLFERPENGLSLDKNFVEAGGELLVGGSGQIYAIDREQGAVRLVYAEEDYYLHPLALRDGVLMAVSAKARGTRIIELWGIDAASGKRLWQREFKGDGEMFGPPYDAAGVIDDDEEIWDWADLPSGFTLITLTSQPYRYTIETLNPKTGQPSDTKTIDMVGDDTVWVPTRVGRSGDILFLTASRDLLGVDLRLGKIVYTGP